MTAPLEFAKVDSQNLVSAMEMLEAGLHVLSHELANEATLHCSCLVCFSVYRADPSPSQAAPPGSTSFDC